MKRTNQRKYLMKLICLLLLTLMGSFFVKRGTQLSAEKEKSALLTFDVPEKKVKLDSASLVKDTIRQGEKVTYTVDYQLNKDFSTCLELEDEEKPPEEITIYFEVRLPVKEAQAAFDFDKEKLKADSYELLKSEPYYEKEEIKQAEETKKAKPKAACQRVLLKKTVKEDEKDSLEVPILTKDTGKAVGDELVIEPLFEVRGTEETETVVETPAEKTSDSTKTTESTVESTIESTTESVKASTASSEEEANVDPKPFIKGKKIIAKAFTVQQRGPMAVGTIDFETMNADDFIPATDLLIRPLSEKEVKPAVVIDPGSSLEISRLDRPITQSPINHGTVYDPDYISYVYDEWRNHRYIDIESSTRKTATTPICNGATTIGFKGRWNKTTDPNHKISQEETVMVKYPVVGTYGKDGRKIGCIATYAVSYYPSSIAGKLSTKSYYVRYNSFPAIQIGDMLYKGIAMTNVDELKAKYQFFYVDDDTKGVTKQAVNQIPKLKIEDSYYTIHSLNNDYSMQPTTNDFYWDKEAVKFNSKDGVTKTAIASDSNLDYWPLKGSSSYKTMRKKDYNPKNSMEDGSVGFWANSDKDFNDYIGGDGFYKNSVTAYQDGDFTFAINTPKDYGRMWWSISSGSIGIQQTDPPAKTVATNDSQDFAKENTAKYGDTVTYRIEQKVNQLGLNTSHRYKNFSMEDAVPQGLTVDATSVRLYRLHDEWSESKNAYETKVADLTGTAGKRNVVGNKVTYTFSDNYVTSAMLLDGETYRLEFKASVPKQGTGTTTYKNTAKTNFNINKYNPTSNETITTVGENKLKVSFTKVQSDNLNAPLKGAEFKLFKQIKNSPEAEKIVPQDVVNGERTNDTWQMVVLENKYEMAVSQANGLVNLGELEAGNYMLVETKAPVDSTTGEVYELPSGQWKLTVNPSKKGTKDQLTIKAIAAEEGVRKVPPAFAIEEQKQSNGTTLITYKLPNIKQFSLPKAGRSGNTPFLFSGLILILSCAGGLLYFRKQARG